MKVHFEELSDSSKIWIYTADRFLTEAEAAVVRLRLSVFLDQWSSHGSPILNFGDIFYNKFLVLFADESKSYASGCSIDNSVHFVQALGAEIGADFFTRLEIQYVSEGSIKTLSGTKELKQKLEEGSINEETVIFDHTVKDKSEFVKSWQKPIKNSWMSRFISKNTTAAI